MPVGFSDNGQKIRITGAKRDEEIFTHEDIGTVNVAAMLRDAKAGKRHVSLMTALIDDGAAKMLRKRDIDYALVVTMSIERAAEPLLGFAMHDGSHLIVDGNNRLARLIVERAETYQMFVFPGGSIPRYRVTVQRWATAIEKGVERWGWRDAPPLELLDQVWGKFTKPKAGALT